MAEKFDIHDGSPWTEMDVEDLTPLKSGDPIEDAAKHRRRSGGAIEKDVRRKTEELGLKYKTLGRDALEPNCLSL